MSIDRRKILLGLVAAGAATTLAGCGGGGGDDRVPTRFVWVLNINPDYTSTDVAFGPDVVVSGMPFPSLSARIEAEFGTYTLSFRDRPSGRVQSFSNVVIDDLSPSVDVFYRYGSSARLGRTPSGIVNYFDSPESLIVDLYDGNGGSLQTSVLPFERSVAQTSRSANCRLLLSRASDGVLVFDSGLRVRPDAIIVFPADATTGLVAVAALSYGASDPLPVRWVNTL